MKNVEMNLFNMFPKHMMEVKRLYANGLLNREEYNEVLETGDKVIEVIRKLELRMKNIGTMLSFSETADKIEFLQVEYIHYLELLTKKRKVKSIDLGIAFITLPVFVFSLLLYLSILGVYWLFSKCFNI